MILQRTSYSDQGTRGRLDGFFTLERPWEDNKPGGRDSDGKTFGSCIPEGTYRARRRHSPHFGYDLFILEDVPGRTGVEIHIGNTIDDIEGCIVLGMTEGDLGGLPAVLDSTEAFKAFMKRMEGIDEFQLIVRGPGA